MKIFFDLIEVLEQEMKSYDKLYSFLEKDFSCVTHLDRDGLSLNNSKKQHLLEKLFKIGEKRDFFVSQISKTYSDGKKMLSLREIIQIAPEELKEKFKQVYKNFLALIEKVKEKNEFNKEYIAMSIKRLRAITNNLNKYQKVDTTYDYKGRVLDTPVGSLVTKEA